MNKEISQSYNEENVFLNELDNDSYGWHFWKEDTNILLENCQESSKGMTTYLTIERPPNNPVLSCVQVNLYSQQQRKKLPLDLASSYQEEFLPWDKMLEYVITQTINKIKSPPSLINIDTEPDEEKIEYLLEPILPKNRPTTLYAPGGKGKSILADYFSVLITHGVCSNGGLPFVPSQTKVLYLDWEDEAETHKRYITAIEKGMNLPHINIFYMSCDKPLNKYINNLKKLINSNQIGLVIIDSQMAATAQESHGMTEAQISSRYYNDLRSLGCTTLTIDHVTKQNMSADETTPAPYGSIVKYNRSRSQWEIKQTQQQDEDIILMALNHRKYNIGKLRKPIGMRIEFENNEDRLLNMLFSSCDISSVPALSKSLPEQIRIKNLLLEEGELEAKQIAEILEKPSNLIRARLNEYKGKIFIKNGNKWGVLYELL